MTARFCVTAPRLWCLPPIRCSQLTPVYVTHPKRGSLNELSGNPHPGELCAFHARLPLLKSSAQMLRMAIKHRDITGWFEPSQDWRFGVVYHVLEFFSCSFSLTFHSEAILDRAWHKCCGVGETPRIFLPPLHFNQVVISLTCSHRRFQNRRRKNVETHTALMHTHIFELRRRGSPTSPSFEDPAASKTLFTERPVLSIAS